MILGFHLSFGAFNAARAEILAHSHRRPLVAKAGEIVRGVGKQLAALDSYEEVEKLALDLLRRSRYRRLRQSHVRAAKRRRIAAELGDTAECGCIRRSRQQHGEQRVLLRASRIDIVNLGRLLAARGGLQDRPRNVHNCCHGQHAPCRNRRATRYEKLGDASPAFRLDNSTSGVNCFLSSVAHVVFLL